MHLLFKLVAGLVATLAVIIAASLIYITQVLDLNDYKADIEQVAQQQGVPLFLKGNLGWQFFPQFGLQLEDIELATPGAPLLKAETVAAAIDVMPLLQGNVEIAGILLKGTKIHAQRNAQGIANWDVFSAQDKPDNATPTQNSEPQTSTTSGSPTTSAPSLAIASLRIEDAQVIYEDQTTDTTTRLEGFNLEANNINFTGETFALQQQFTIHLQDLPALTIKTQGNISVDANQGQIALPQLQVTVAPLTHPKEIIELTLTGSSAIEPPQPDFKLTLAPMNPANWLNILDIELPPMAANDALSHLALSTHLTTGKGYYQLTDLNLEFDQSHFTGEATAYDSGALAMSLNGDTLNIDRYLPPATPEPSKAKTNNKPANPAQQTAASTVLLSNEPLPLEGLKDLDIDATFNLQQLQANNLKLSDAELKIKAKAGVIKLQRLAANLYNGKIIASARLDARQPIAKLSSKGKLTSLSIQPFLKDLTDSKDLAGSVNVDYTLNTQGKSQRDFQQQLNAHINALAGQLTINEMDVEKSFCELAALINQKPLPADQSWKGHTELQDLTTTIKVKGTQVNIQSLSAGVEHFQLKARGNSNYLKGQFDIKGEALFTGQKDAARSCQMNNKWRNRELPLRCKGEFDNIGAKTCGPDGGRLDDLLRDEAKARAKEKIDAEKQRLKDKLGDKLDDKLKGLLGL